MKRILAGALVLGLAGCYAAVTPQGTYIEPMVDFYLAGPPAVVVEPPGVAVAPLPPVYVVPDRRVYYYNNLYYYFWGDTWYWGRERRGPWHTLDRRYWPSRVEPRGDHRRDHDDRGRHRD
ncbi:MAG TPA: hypothetical protein VI078_07240 [bacterium]